MSLRNSFDNLAVDSSITWLKRIFQALKPLGVITGGGSNRLSVDVNNVVAGTITTVGTVSTITAGTITTVGTVTTITNAVPVGNVATIGTIPAFDLMKAMSRQAYNSGIRAKIA